MIKQAKRDLQFYVGDIKAAYLGYADQPDVREGAASGGFVSSFLIYLLHNKIINGAVVTRCVVKNNSLEAETILATSREEILSCRTSIYFDFPLITSTICESIRQFSGKVAIVGLPCDLRKLQKICHKDRALAEKIELTIGLFCGHNSKKELMERVLHTKKIPLENVENICFRKGLWRGQTHVMLKNGREITFPFKHFSTYQNMHILSAEKCFYCADHTAETADIAAGDIWVSEMKKQPIKHSVFISRTERGDAHLLGAINDRTITCEGIDIERVFQSNKRALIYHKAIRARALVGRIAGKKLYIKGKYPKARWNEILAAVLVAVVWKVCRWKRGRDLIFALPRGIVWCYLVVFKILTNF